MSERKVPELSLLSYVNGQSSDQVKFVDQLFSGIKEYGFIILKDHPIAEQKVNKAYDIIHEFFQQPQKIKEKYIISGGRGQRGFTAFGKESAKGNKVPDLKEFWHVGRELPPGHRFEKFYAKNLWPQELPEFKNTMLELYNAMDATSKILLNALGRALDVKEGFFEEMIEYGNSIHRLIHYPSLEKNKIIDENCVRAAAHEDINLITMLVGATDDGLQLLDRDGSWLDVSTRPGEIVVDSGDMMKVLTNDVIPATTHRVVNPSETSSTRYSMPFFVHPHPEADLVCLPSCIGEGKKYEDINSHDFLLQRLEELGLKKV